MFQWKTADTLLSWVSGSREVKSEAKVESTNWNEWLGAVKSESSESSLVSGMAQQVKEKLEETKQYFADKRGHRSMWLLVAPLSAAALVRIAAPLVTGGVASNIPALATVFASTTTSHSALGYVVQLGSSVLMMMSIKGLGSHSTSKRGNLFGMAGVGTAILGVVLSSWTSPLAPQLFWFLPVAIVGQFVGITVAKSVQMDQMPELVAAFHSLTGLAAVLVGVASQLGHGHAMSIANMIETFIGVSVGAATFSGSIAAALKLNGMIPGGPIGLNWRTTINAVSLIKLALLFTGYLWVSHPGLRLAALCGNTVVSLVLGTMLVLPIGGADIPIVISLLNSLSGLATSATGFSMNNSMLVMTGALIASSGAILSDIMCKGINRSLINVLAGGFGVDSGTSAPTSTSVGPNNTAQEIFPISVSQLVSKLQQSKKVLIVPGYGMAVARCQGSVAELFTELQKRGIDVVFGIHPVAGRLPGHMNVILSEADIPYDVVKEMDEVNREIGSFDVAIILGANDIVNPATASDPTSPIFGMPAIEVWKIPSVVVMKRSMNTGYSGVDNPLFYLPNTNMLFGDAKESVEKLHVEVASSGVWPREETRVGTNKTRHFSAADNAAHSQSLPDLSLLPAGGRKVGALSSHPVDKRIPLSPKVAYKFRQAGFEVLVPSGLGKSCGWSDTVFEQHGAKIVANETYVMEQSDVVLKVTPLDGSLLEVSRPPEESNENPQILVTSFAASEENVTKVLPSLANRPNLAVFNLNQVPRISRAQSMDILSSMANLAGYKAVINAFHRIGKLSRSSVTAGGNIAAARVFVIGCGVAGLSAIATAHALGATVFATDVRAATKEQVESIGVRFVSVDEGTEIVSEKGGYAGQVSESFAELQRKLYNDYTAASDVVITTAMVPGKPAPKLISAEMVRAMKPGSIVVDLASPSGGNCDLTKTDTVYTDESSQVMIDGTSNYASELAQLASELYSQNCFAFVENMCGKSKLAKEMQIDLNDVIVSQTLVVMDGDIKYPPPPLPVQAVPQQPANSALSPSFKTVSAVPMPLPKTQDDSLLLVGALALAVLGITADRQTAKLAGDFLLSAVIGHFTVSSVTPALHTPLISVTNAISGIIVVGGMLELDRNPVSAKSLCALAAVLASMVNVSGGFAVTDRMLAMFRRSGQEE